MSGQGLRNAFAAEFSPGADDEPDGGDDKDQPGDDGDDEGDESGCAFGQDSAGVAKSVCDFGPSAAVGGVLDAEGYVDSDFFRLVSENLTLRRFAIKLRLCIAQLFLNFHQIFHRRGRLGEHGAEVIPKTGEVFDFRFGIYDDSGLVFPIRGMLRDFAQLLEIIE